MTKASLKVKIKELNPDCNPKHLSLMNLAELKLAADGNLSSAVSEYKKRLVLSNTKSSEIQAKSDKNKAIKVANTKKIEEFDKKKFGKNLKEVTDEIEKAINILGKGNSTKGRRMLMNAKEIARRNNAANLKKIGKKISGYDKIIRTIDAIAMRHPTSGGSTFGDNL